MNKKILLFLLFFPLVLLAQEKKESDFKFNLKGFIKADYIYDSRQNVEGREGFFILYPKPIVEDAKGIDINDKASANQYCMTTRLGLEIQGPDIFGAKTSGLIESDYTGPSNIENNAFRLRHAYIKLDWAKTSFLMGQYWHPMDVPEMIPSVLSLNTGAPTHCFSRGPQIRLTQMTGPVKWIAVAYSQRDHVSIGPQGPTNKYLRDAVLPDLSLQAQWTYKNLFAGAGINYKELHFRTFTLDNQLMEDQPGSLSFIGFAKYENKKWDFKLQGVYAENLVDHLMLGGAAVTIVDSLNAHIEYSNVKAASGWATVYFKHKGWKIGGFGGYIQNLGSENKIVGPFYGRGGDIHHVYRFSPQWSYQRKNLIIANEWEYTVAAYGTPDEFGVVNDTYKVENLRFTFSLIYLFNL
jgi:hypothetical protein